MIESGPANLDSVAAPHAEPPADIHPVDTTANAERTANLDQPFAELGLAEDEYARIRDILGRRPTEAELAMYAVMWSEHCSYKSSKKHLAYFGQTTTPGMKAKMLAGIGENAGVVGIGDGWAVTFKVESHNHPSYVEPYQGAATGVGGIVRDILAMGARPLAVADPLRFGPADAPDTRRVLPGVVAGIAGYGNCLGLPNIGGEVVFDESYAGNPLVNAMCVGAMKADDLHLAHASGKGNKIILFGARTGLDGIGGVSVLASETFSGDEQRAAARSCRACRSATRSPRRCSSSVALSCTTANWCSVSRTSVVRGWRAPPPNWRPPVTAACTSTLTGFRCGRWA